MIAQTLDLLTVRSAPAWRDSLAYFGYARTGELYQTTLQYTMPAAPRKRASAKAFAIFCQKEIEFVLCKSGWHVKQGSHFPAGILPRIKWDISHDRTRFGWW